MESSLSSQPSQPLLTTCSICGHATDVAGAEPFSQMACGKCGATMQVRARFDHFQILREVGVGGMSRVFEAEDIALQRRVALKILNRECSQDAVRLAQFEREARLTASFSHPHIVKVFSVGRDQSHLYIAMELVPGGSLDDRIRATGAQPEEQILTLAIQMAQGLRVAHAAGLIHRDIKPGNLLFAGDGAAKIADFGLALVQGKDVVADEELWATPYYVPPEKLNGDPDTFRGDMYSLGATLFHALAGKPPYAKDTNSIEELKKIKSFPVHLRPVAPQVSEETCAIIDRLLSRRPEHRYRSYDELLEDFEFARKRLQNKDQEAERAKWRGLIRYGSVAAGVLVLAAIALAVAGRSKSTTGKGALKVAGDEVGVSATAKYLQARESLTVGLIARAAAAFQELARSPSTQQPTLNWALFHAGLCALLEHKRDEARVLFDELAGKAAVKDVEGDPELADFFEDTAALLARTSGEGGDEPERFSRKSMRSLALLPLGVRAWLDGRAAPAETLLRRFAEAEPPEAYAWIAGYQRLAAPYLAEFDLLRGAPAPDGVSDRAAVEQALAKIDAALAALKLPGGPVRPQLEARREEGRRSLAEREKSEEQIRSAQAEEQARAELAAVAAAVDQIQPFREGYRFLRAVETLRGLQPKSPAARQRVEDQLFLWQGGEDFLRLLAEDLGVHGFTGTLERTPPLPPVAEATIVRATREKWLVKAGKIETMLDLSATTPAFLVSLGERFVDLTADSDGYYRRRESIVAFAKLCGMDDYARFAGELLMRESVPFRDRWPRLARLSLVPKS